MKSEDLGCTLESVVFKVVQDVQPFESEEISCDSRQRQESVGVVSRTFIQGELMANVLGSELGPGVPGTEQCYPVSLGSAVGPLRGVDLLPGEEASVHPTRSLPVVCRDVSP